MLERIIEDNSNYVIRLFVYVCLILLFIMVWIVIR